MPSVLLSAISMSVVCLCMHVHSCMCAHTHQRGTLGVFLYCLPLYFWSQCFSLNLELTALARSVG